MTSMERLNARLKGEPVDKIPNLNIAMALVAKEAGVSYKEYAQDYRRLVEGNLICVEKYGFDAVSVISDSMREASAFGAAVIFPENAVPYSSPELFEDGYDLSKLVMVDPHDSPRTLDRIKGVALFKEKVGGSIPIIGWVEGVLAECADLRGVNKIMYDLMEDSDQLKELMEVVHQQQKVFAKAQVEAGADIIGVGNAVASLIGPDLYKQYAFDYDKKCVDYIHSLGAKVKLHICGNITSLLPSLKLIAPDILDLDWMVDLAESSTFFADTNISLCGNFDPVSVMERGTVAEVLAKLEDAISLNDPRYIAAGGCEIPASTPEENLIAMNDALFC